MVGISPQSSALSSAFDFIEFVLRAAGIAGGAYAGWMVMGKSTVGAIIGGVGGYFFAWPGILAGGIALAFVGPWSKQAPRVSLFSVF